jgi:hypothetical protein
MDEVKGSSKLDNNTEPKEPESSAIRIETAHIKKALKLLIHQDYWRSKILEGTW